MTFEQFEKLSEEDKKKIKEFRKSIRNGTIVEWFNKDKPKKWINDIEICLLLYRH